MNGYLGKLTAWANGTGGRFTVEKADNGLYRWVTIRRDDGHSASGYGATYDEAAVSAQRLHKAVSMTW